MISSGQSVLHVKEVYELIVKFSPLITSDDPWEPHPHEDLRENEIDLK